MARTINKENFASKRKAILDAAQRLVLTKGYAQMSIQDILETIQISSGAFHHYFDSRETLLEALIEQMQQEAEKPLIPIVHDPHLSAMEKFQRFCSTLDSSRTTQKAFIATLARVWFADDNSLVREKVDQAIIYRREPLLTEIIHQGIREGVFTNAYPNQTGGIILSLARGMGNTLVKLMLSYEQKHEIDEIAATYTAYADAIERVLGVPYQFLYRPDAAAIRIWLDVEDIKTK